nr:hypothetical protein [Halomonas nanhaiensis]
MTTKVMVIMGIRRVLIVLDALLIGRPDTLSSIKPSILPVRRVRLLTQPLSAPCRIGTISAGTVNCGNTARRSPLRYPPLPVTPS